MRSFGGEDELHRRPSGRAVSGTLLTERLVDGAGRASARRPRRLTGRASEPMVSLLVGDGAVGGERGPRRRAGRQRGGACRHVSQRGELRARRPRCRPPPRVAWARAAASRSVRANTASRSERCATAQSTACTRRAMPALASRGDSRAGFTLPVPSGPPAPVTPRRQPGLPMRSPPAISGSAGAADISDPFRVRLPAPSLASRTGAAELPSASATSAPGSKPSPAAWFSQTLAQRVAVDVALGRRGSSAPRAGRGADRPRWRRRPRSATAASISARRVENASIAVRETPAISKRPSAWVFSMP